MSLPDLCLRRPVATVTCAVAALVLGMVSLARLPLEYLPEIEGHSLTVTCAYPASSPQEVERVIARPLEEELASLQNLESLESTSRSSGVTVRIELDDDADVDEAALEVRERIDRARAFLPDDLGRVEVRRWRASDRPVLRCRVATAPDTSQVALERFVDEVLIARLGRLDGVGNVEVQGLARRRVLVEIDRARLAQAGLTANDVARSLRARNRNVSAGQLRSGGKVLSVRILGELGDVAAVAALPVGDRLLGDVASVREETAPLDQIERLNGHEAITVRVSKESGANSVEVCRRARAELEAIVASRSYGSFSVEIFSDDAERILARLANLRQSALFGGVLLCAVLFLFLRELRPTLIVASTIPCSVVLTFGLLWVARQLGVSISLNVVSMMGLILGIGLVVDFGIVVLENVFRLRQEGLPAREAAAQGAREVSKAITASMVTSLIVFVPLLFSDSFGRWMRPLAIVVCAAVLSSLLVALTLVPLLASRLGNTSAGSSGAKPGRVVQAYTGVLRRVLRFRWPILLIVLPLCGWQIQHFFANVERSWGGGESTREVNLKVIVPRAFTPGDRRELFTQLEGIVLENAKALDVASVTTSFRASAEAEASGRGSRRHGGASGDRIELVLNEGGPGERKSVEEVRERLRALLPAAPGVVFNLGASQRMGGGGGRSVRVLVQGRTSGELLGSAQAVADALEAVEGVEEVELAAAARGAGLVIRPDRRLAPRYGVGADAIARAVSSSLSERAVTRLRSSTREIDVILRMQDHQSAGLTDLLMGLVPRAGDEPPLPLGNLVDVIKTPSPSEITRVDRRAVVSVVASVLEGEEMRTVSARVEATLAGFPLPRGITWTLDQRVSRWRRGERQSMGAVGLALLLVLMVLAALFESYVDATVIAITVPFALVGVAWAFWATDTRLGSMASIGLMILIGIVVNHGIVLVDRLRLLLSAGVDPHEALVQAGADRLRPIVMTAATTVLGLLPIVGQHLLPDVFSADAGAQMYGPIGLAVASGLAVSTALTLLVLPATLAAVMDLRALAARFGRVRS